MENQQPPPQSTSLCRANCGFYGSPATEDFCSKCFKDSIKRKQETAPRLSPNSNLSSAAKMTAASTSVDASVTANADQMTDIPIPTVKIEDIASTLADTESKLEIPPSLGTIMSTSSSSASLAQSIDESGSESGASATRPKKPNRCHVCNKRVGLTGFTCRCEGLFCGEHRYDNMHNCTFDYKTMEREELRKNNPVVKSEKIQRI